jgi:hypothetical protein
MPFSRSAPTVGDVATRLNVNGEITPRFVQARRPVRVRAAGFWRFPLRDLGRSIHDRQEGAARAV